MPFDAKKKYKDSPNGAFQYLKDEGVGLDWTSSHSIRWAPDEGFDKGWILVNDATHEAYVVYPSKKDFEDVDYDVASEKIDSYESSQGRTLGSVAVAEPKTSTVPKGTFEAKHSMRLTTENDVRRFIREAIEKQRTLLNENNDDAPMDKIMKLLHGAAVDWDVSMVKVAPTGGTGWLVINDDELAAYIVYPESRRVEVVNYEKAWLIVDKYMTLQGAKPRPSKKQLPKTNTKGSALQNAVQRSGKTLKEHFIGGMASIPAIGGGVMGMSLSESDEFDDSYAQYEKKREELRAAKKTGLLRELEQNFQAAQEEGLTEDEAAEYALDATAHSTGTSVWSDMSSMSGRKRPMKEADDVVRLAKDDPHAGIEPNAVTPTQAKQFADVLADYVEDHLDEIAAFFVMKHDDDGLYPERIEDVPGMAASIAEKVAASFDVKALVERLVKYTFNKALYGE